jgi:hypothetical protein
MVPRPVDGGLKHHSPTSPARGGGDSRLRRYNSAIAALEQLDLSTVTAPR